MAPSIIRIPLTKDQKARFRVIADQISAPATAKPGGTLIGGAHLISEHGTLTDRAGNPIEPNKQYYLQAAPAINHFRRMCLAFAAGGMASVEQYLQPYKKPSAEAPAV